MIKATPRKQGKDEGFNPSGLRWASSPFLGRAALAGMKMVDLQEQT